MPAASLLVFPRRLRPAAPMQDGKAWLPTARTAITRFSAASPAYFVSASRLGPALIALGAKVKMCPGPRASGTCRSSSSSSLPQAGNDREIALKPNEILTEIVTPRGERQERDLRDPRAGGDRLASGDRLGRIEDEGQHGGSGRIVLGHVGPTPYVATEAAQMLAGKTIDEATAEAIGKAAVAGR